VLLGPACVARNQKPSVVEERPLQRNWTTPTTILPSTRSWCHSAPGRGCKGGGAVRSSSCRRDDVRTLLRSSFITGEGQQHCWWQQHHQRRQGTRCGTLPGLQWKDGGVYMLQHKLPYHTQVDDWGRRPLCSRHRTWAAARHFPRQLPGRKAQPRGKDTLEKRMRAGSKQRGTACFC
jgi:hypothetical protein